MENKIINQNGEVSEDTVVETLQEDAAVAVGTADPVESVPVQLSEEEIEMMSAIPDEEETTEIPEEDIEVTEEEALDLASMNPEEVVEEAMQSRPAGRNRRDIERVNTINPYAEVETELQERRSIQREVRNANSSFSAKRGAGEYLSGTIASFRLMRIGSQYAACALIMYKSIVPVWITYDRLTTIIPAEGNGVEGTRRYAQECMNLIRQRVGQAVRFHVFQIVEGDTPDKFYALGNRLTANAQISYIKYQRRSRRGYATIEGQLCEATVCYVRQRSICVECQGIEHILPEREVSWSRGNDIRSIKDKNGNQKYAPGKTVHVRIMKITREPLDVQFSIREATKNPADYFADIIEPGLQCTGVVTNITDNRIFVSLPDFGGLTGACSWSIIPNVSPESIKVGSKVLFTIRNKRVLSDGTMGYDGNIVPVY